MATDKALAAELFETTIKFRVNNVSALKTKFYGPKVSVSDKTFRPMLQVGEQKEQRCSTLALFVECDWQKHVELQQRSCKVKIQFILHSQDGISKDLTREASCTFNPEVPDWGYSNYIPWYDLIKPAWMTDDSISLEIKLEINKTEIEDDTDVAPGSTELQKKDMQVDKVDPQGLAKKKRGSGER